MFIWSIRTPATHPAKNVIVSPMSFHNPTPTEICKILRDTHTIAVVGLSPNEARPSHRVAKALQSHGYKIIPVRPLVVSTSQARQSLENCLPLVQMVLGEKAYTDLESLYLEGSIGKVDIVDVFRTAEHVPAIVDSCIKLGIKNLWLQDGVIHEEEALRAQAAGITVVMDRCMWRDFSTLCAPKISSNV